MDFAHFFRLLLERKWIILAVSALASVATFLVTRQQDQVYLSKALIATGITESTAPTAAVEQGGTPRPFEIENQFSNLKEILRSKTVMGLLSLRLVEHDLLADRPFRDWEELREKYSDDALGRALELFRAKFEPGAATVSASTLFGEAEEDYVSGRLADDSTIVDEPVPRMVADREVFGNTADDDFLKDVLRTMGYNYASLVSAMAVYRVGNTDYMRLEFRSESPELAAFMANTLAEEFIQYYSRVKSERSDNSVEFFTRLSFEKKKELDRKNEELKQYKLENQIVNIGDQSAARIAQIQTLELQREQENKRIPASQQAIRAIERELSGAEAAVGAKQANSLRVQTLRDELTDLGNEAVAITAAGGDDADIRRRMEEKRREINAVITGLAAEDPELSNTTADLLATKLQLEIDLEVARAGVRSIDRELGRLRGTVGGFVEGDATIQNMEREIELVQGEYLDYVNKLNMAKLMSMTSGNQLSLIEPGEVPDSPEPSKTLFLSAFAGGLALAFSVSLIFGLAYLDFSLKSPTRFRRMTDVPLIGYLNRLKHDNLDLDTFFNTRSHDPELETFKQLLRKVRFQLEQHNAKRILVTSTKQHEGKSFLIISLAYSLSLNNKKVLIIDTNFKNNTLTEMLQTDDRENLLSNHKLIGDARLEEEFTTTGIISRTNHSGIDLIGSKGGYNSPSEIFAGKNFDKLLDGLELTYDYIFLEGSAMNDYSDTQELVPYVDHVMAVFSAETELKNTDKQSLEFLDGLEDKFLGGVLNRVELKHTA